MIPSTEDFYIITRAVPSFLGAGPGHPVVSAGHCAIGTDISISYVITSAIKTSHTLNTDINMFGIITACIITTSNLSIHAKTYDTSIGDICLTYALRILTTSVK